MSRPRIPFTAEQIQAFREYYPSHYCTDTARVFGISKDTVRTLAKEYGLSRDETALAALRKKSSAKAAAVTQARQKGRKREVWEAGVWGCEVIKRLWPDHSIAEIIAAMSPGNRYWHYVIHHANALHLEYDAAKLEEKRLHGEALRAKLDEGRFVEWAKSPSGCGKVRNGGGCYEVYSPTNNFCTPRGYR
jgi:hypothetical protein